MQLMEDQRLEVTGSRPADAPALKALGMRWSPIKRLWWHHVPADMAWIYQERVRAIGLRVKPEIEPPKALIDRQARASRAPDAPFPLFAHQKEAVAKARQDDHLALFLEQGTGKTRAALEVVRLRQRWPVIVVAPKTVMAVWREKIELLLPNWTPVVCAGTRRQKIDALARWWASDRVIFVWSYATLATFNYIALLDVNGRRRRLTRNHLAECVPWHLAICDESSHIKHARSNRSQAVHALSRTPYRMILTGTPITHAPTDLWSQFRFLAPSVLEPTFREHAARYEVQCKRVFYGNEVTIPVGYKNVDELYARTAPHALRRKKSECLDLPDKVYQRITIEATREQRRAYRAMAEELVAEIGDRLVAANGVLPQLLRLQEIANGFAREPGGAPLFFDGNPKTKALLELCDRLLPDHQLVVFHKFTPDAMIVRRALQAWSEQEHRACSITAIDGSTAVEERGERIAAFQRGEHQVFLAQLQTVAFGVTLTAADYAAFWSNDWNPDLRFQAEDRLHRHGQDKTVVYIDLALKNSIDETIIERVEKKRKYGDRFDDMAARLSARDVHRLLLPRAR